jgi:hypothetical protein
MLALINGGGFVPYYGLGMEEMTQEYDIDVEPLFDQYVQPMGQDTFVDVDVEGEGEGEGEGDGEGDGDGYADKYGMVDRNDVTNAGDPKKKVSQRTTCYIGKDDRCLWKSWVLISEDHICG